MCVRPHKDLSAAGAAAYGASVVIFNDGEAEPGEAASSAAAVVLPSQRSNVTPARKEATRHIRVAAVKSERSGGGGQ